ncbi:hypothetical protein EVAR_14789_1 [Eumeta japonica]|uniref:Uncharacterized protein n=1 Tax=Eumeta variegata TaxID=151549 RepID=A0A4C1TXP9_EUMVA|nr:hypothetical protein EVAR_14789_1 [Eumeta japonica]
MFCFATQYDNVYIDLLSGICLPSSSPSTTSRLREHDAVGLGARPFGYRRRRFVIGSLVVFSRSRITLVFGWLSRIFRRNVRGKPQPYTACWFRSGKVYFITRIARMVVRCQLTRFKDLIPRPRHDIALSLFVCRGTAAVSLAVRIRCGCPSVVFAFVSSSVYVLVMAEKN